MQDSLKADLVEHAMKRGPECIHDLWHTMFHDEYDSARRTASVSIEFLNHPERYPPVSLQAAEAEFPIGTFRRNWKLPRGWQVRGGIASFFSRIFRRCLTQFFLPGEPDTRIVVSMPDRADSRFPWQLAISSNLYLKSTDGERLSSRYVPVAGSTGYEVCYKAPHVISMSMESGFRPLQRAQVTFVSSPGLEYNVLLETDSLERHKSAYDEFIASLS